MVGIANRTYSTTLPKRHTEDCIGNVFCHESTKDRSGRGMGRYLLHPEQVVKGASACRVEATARGRALGTERSPPLAPSQGCEQETTTSETTERQHEAGRLGCSLPLLSLPVRDASRRRRPQRRRSDSTRPGAWDVAFPSSRSQSGMRAGDDNLRDDGATARGRALWM